MRGNTYLNDSRYRHSATVCTGVGKSHTDAQNNFILSYKTNFVPTMLFDGVWWEYKAKGTFDMLERQGETDKRYGIQLHLKGELLSLPFKCKKYFLVLLKSKI